MTTTTVPATWPTEERYEPVSKALSEAFTEVERLQLDLDKILVPWMDKGVYPDSAPTLATVGALYSFLEDLRTEAESFMRFAKDLQQDLWQIDALRRDWSPAAKADDAG
jgi:hypothetical protein